jgi:hypothetical protein
VAHGLETINWSAPWLTTWREKGERLAHCVHEGMTVAAALNTGATKSPVQFVSPQTLPAGEAYEAYIFRTGQVPTRDGLHDFFNGLCWLQFPQTKQRLNALHMEHIATTGIQPTRGPARDGLTLFDENAAFFQGPDVLWNALVRKDWHTVFITERRLWSSVQLILFGHALLEKLVTPRKPITAHVHRVLCSDTYLSAVDTWVAQSLRADRLAAKAFAHLPILGVPGWHAANTQTDFYADRTVFRMPSSEQKA